MPKTVKWMSIDIACPPEVVDEVAAEIGEALGTGAEIGERSIRIYVEHDSYTPEWKSRLREVLEEIQRSLKLAAPLSTASFPLLEDDWAERWKVHFKPIRIGRHFVICPTWEEARAGREDRVIWMEPGRAFGTGHHETTRLCLEWIEDRATARGEEVGGTLLDLGTGSGILAMAAALSGFGRVVGADIDPDAVEVARENAARNGLEGRIELRVGGASDVPGQFDVVLANIQALPLMRMAHDIEKKVRSTGQLALSGILVEQQEEVRAAYEGVGFELVLSRSAGEWCLLVFEKLRKVKESHDRP